MTKFRQIWSHCLESAVFYLRPLYLKGALMDYDRKFGGHFHGFQMPILKKLYDSSGASYKAL